MAKPRFERTTSWAATARVVFLGGNGHSASRLLPVRSALARMVGAGKCAPIEICEVEYAGFERRTRAATWDAFLSAVEAQIRESTEGRALIYGTGIGGLILLALRARDVALNTPVLLQGPVLWGLETRRFPLLMRSGFGRALVKFALRLPPVQWRFAGKYFVRRPPRDIRRSFFRGYADCAAFGDLFRWLGPPLLRGMEAAFRAKPERLAGISVWWGGRDRVVTTEELRRTEVALGAKWPLKEFPGWGHYPMLDAPEEWVTELSGELRKIPVGARSGGGADPGPGNPDRS